MGSNLLTHMSRTDLQGLPRIWPGWAWGGVWPGESLNVAETYLRRGDIEKTISLLKAALNHSYSTNVFKEEIKVDKRLPVACKSGNAAKVEDGHGTGDMPEAWGNANLVLLVRDMLLREDGDTLRLLTGIPARWIGAGEEMGVQSAPTTFGAPVSLRLRRPMIGISISASRPHPDRFPRSQSICRLRPASKSSRRASTARPPKWPVATSRCVIHRPYRDRRRASLSGKNGDK